MMFGQNDGIENERQLVGAFDKMQIQRLSAYQQKFIKDIYQDAGDTDVVQAKKVGGMGYKPDVELEVNGQKHFLSVKKGGGNSVHQEKTDLFIHYCMSELDMTESERDSLLMYLYGDGTIDGDSLPEERLKDQELLDTYKKEIEIVQKFLNRNKRNLLERFLIYGRMGAKEGIKADYLYHGDAIKGVWCPLNYDTIDYLVDQPNAENSPLAIGPLTLQVWNRNLDGKPEMENRRHSVQIKWGACKTYIEKINQYQAIKEKERKSVTEKRRIIGDNRQGFENQDNLIAIMNDNRVSDLPFAVKNIVTSMFPHVALSERIRASKVTGNDVKPRVSIVVNGEKKNLTVFMGSGNAVHQEKFDGFLQYCRDELGISVEEENAFLTIMYGDGTLDGNSLAEDRLKSTEEVKKHYSKQVMIAQAFFDRNKEDLIERFLVYGKGGKQKNIKADYIYYGTDVTGRLASYVTVVNYLKEKKDSDVALLSLGSLTAQPWNRNPTAKANLESRRHSLQIKWGGMKQDLSAICDLDDTQNKGTAEGDWEEYELVSRLNRDANRTGKLWKTISNELNRLQLKDIYAVRVSNTVYSKLSERMVLPKADVYLVKGRIAHEVLLNNNYWLDEDVINDLDVTPVSGSGISCKRPDSKNFTYLKLTQKSFLKLFNDVSMGAGISLFVTEKDVKLNSQVLEHWNIDEKKMLEIYKEDFISAGIDSSKWSITNAKICKIIKAAATNNMKQCIIKNSNIANGIFKGTDFFEEPYTANYIYKNGELSKTYIPSFSITTGSGRHKGVYTIVIKP